MIPASETVTVKEPSRRLARKVMPFIAADSALLPPDAWIVSALREMYKTVAPFRRDVRAAAGVAVLAVGAFLGGVAGVVLPAAGMLTLAGGCSLGLAALGCGAVAAWRGRVVWRRARRDTAPALKEGLGTRYAKYKMDEIANAWRQRLEAARLAKVSGQAPAAKGAAKGGARTKPLRENFSRPSGDKESGDTLKPSGPASPQPPAPPPAQS